MHYLHLLIFIASMACVRIVRRLIPPCAPVAAVIAVDEDIWGWIDIMVNSADHAAITQYARNF